MPPVPLSNKRRYEDADTLSLMAGAKSNRFSVTSGDGGRQIDGRDIGPCPPPILGAEIRSLLWKRGGQRHHRKPFFDLAVSESARAAALPCALLSPA
ncbi:hypothetical protein THAOC_27665 [Thalassiosira oceanica]|uniref:Uncharacterized protein n=1 Tax=Thalassiosira oceanica TaxID=159749 RepID=K0S230_THAOC|nr:hypothetical protein THAOC_27665 [Thalassiosira oceanica]|eukprot:EJK52982.1 hypothetical protein THAOC_27665 [Thalassiosira oceanica]